MKTTFSRTFFPTAIILLTALLLIGISFQMLGKAYLEDRLTDSFENDCEIISELASIYHSEESLSSHNFLINLSTISRISGADAFICNARGKLLLCADSPLGCSHQGLVIRNQEYLSQALEQGCITGTGILQGLYEEARYVVCMPFFLPERSNPAGFVFVSIPTAEIQTILSRFSNTYLIISILVVFLAVAVIRFYVRRTSKPLQDMATAARAFEHGNLSVRVKSSEDDPQEVQELALAFNNMAVSLEKSDSQHKEFVANVSHELKTPMTTIGGYIDGILDGTIPQEKHHHYMQIVSGETKRLSRLVHSMLDISRMQDRQKIPESKKSHFDITTCAPQVLLTFEKKITDKNIDVVVDMPDHAVYTVADEDAITQVIYNLVDNAVKFTPLGGNLTLRIRESGEKIYVSIANSGDTIPPEELPSIFERFHKLDKSRNQNRDGWGLGLYIVRTLISAHGENISVSSENGTTEFTFTLPVIH